MTGIGVRTASDSSAAARPSSVSTAGMDAARELAQLRHRVLQLVDRLRRARPRLQDPTLGAEPQLRRAQLERERDEALLGAVVDVPLDPAALLVPGGDDSRARLLHLRELRAELGREARVLERQAGGHARRVEEPRVVAQAWVVHERRDRLAVALEHA